MKDPVVLIVAPAPDLMDVVRAAAAHAPRSQVISASELGEALDLARRHRPAAILVDAALDPPAALEMIRALRAEPDPLAWTVALIAGADDPSLERQASRDGADHVVARPLLAARLQETLATAFRLADLRERIEVGRVQIDALHERHAADVRDIEALNDELERSTERLRALLIGLLELGVPGALDRGLRIAQLARQLANRFGIPAELVGDLEQAAQLHELGRLVAGKAPGPNASSGTDEAWQYAQSTVAILKRAEGLEGTAEVIGSIYENWDGTGRPARWQAGQIPLRCRILRVLVDFIGALEKDQHPSTAALLESFEEHAGTLYDPLVLVHLKTLLEGRNEDEVMGSKVLLPILELRVGMILAEDLYTEGGVKLLARDTELTQATLEVIRRRHGAEPILQGAAVRRTAA